MPRGICAGRCQKFCRVIEMKMLSPSLSLSFLLFRTRRQNDKMKNKKRREERKRGRREGERKKRGKKEREKRQKKDRVDEERVSPLEPNTSGLDKTFERWTMTICASFLGAIKQHLDSLHPSIPIISNIVAAFKEGTLSLFASTQHIVNRTSVKWRPVSLLRLGQSKMTISRPYSLPIFGRSST